MERTPNVLCIQLSKADEVWDKVVPGLRGLYELVMKQQLQQEQSLGYWQDVDFSTRDTMFTWTTITHLQLFE